MRALLLAVSFSATLIALPATAQQGPAGVPGAPGLAPPPPTPQVVVALPEAPSQPPPSVKPSCGKSKAGKPEAACRPKKKAKAPAACSNSSDPARCEQYRKTRELCKSLADPAYRQCLRDNLSPPN